MPEAGASPFAVLAALAAGEPMLVPTPVPVPTPAAAGQEAAKSAPAAPAWAGVPGVPALAGPTADDLALALVQAANPNAASHAGPDKAAAGGIPAEAVGRVRKTGGALDEGAEALPDEAAAPAPDPSLAMAIAAPAPPALRPTPAPVASGAGEPAPAAALGSQPPSTPRTAALPSPLPSLTVPAALAGDAAGDPAPGPDPATATAEAVSPKSRAAVPVRTAASDPEGRPAAAGAVLAALPDAVPHELPEIAVAAASALMGPDGRAKGPESGVRTIGSAVAQEPVGPGRSGEQEQPSNAPPAAGPATPAETDKAVHARPPAEAGKVSREDEPAPKPSADRPALAEAAKPVPDLLSGPSPSHAGPHPVRTAEAGPAPPLPGEAGARIPVVPNVPLAAVPVEIGLRSLAGLNRFEIRLEPEDLGRIDVRLDLDGDKVQARLTVDRVETLALLQRDARTLERAFEQAGLKPSEGGIDLTLRDPRGDARGQGGDRPGRETPEQRPLPDPDGEPAPRIVRTLWRAPGRLDLRI